MKAPRTSISYLAIILAGCLGGYHLASAVDCPGTKNTGCSVSCTSASSSGTTAWFKCVRIGSSKQFNATSGEGNATQAGDCTVMWDQPNCSHNTSGGCSGNTKANSCTPSKGER